MIQVLKFPHRWGKYYFLSCLHKAHDRDFIYGRRGFKSQPEHDLALKKRWNDTVPADGVVFSLGDTAFTNHAEDEIREIFYSYNFSELYLSPGNHTAGWRQIYSKYLRASFGMDINEMEVYPLRHKLSDQKTVIFVPNLYEIMIGGQSIVCCHYPIISHNHQKQGGWAIVGHTHGNLEYTRKEYKFGRRLDVCVENFGGPVSLEEIAKIMAEKSADNLDHHS